MGKPMVTRQGSAEAEERYLGAFSRHSAKLSLIFRMLAYGILGMELFKEHAISPVLVYAVLADLAQYAVASAIWNWNCFRINNSPKHRAYWWTNFPANAFFYAKVVLLAVYLLGRV